MRQQPQLRVGPKSHPGKVRSENQDRMSRFVSPFGEVFIVADGMGGHQGGATAASMTIEGFESHLSTGQLDAAVEIALQDAAAKTNEKIFRAANSGDPATAKMGSTVVLALISGDRVSIAHAGDSRAYLFRGGRLLRLTKDHSAVQRMIDHNMLTEVEARDHPDASVILRAFGQKPEIEIEVSTPFTLQAGDGLLLCTDGLCGYVDDAEIARAIAADEDPQRIADALVEMALDAGGEDNVTVQFLQFGPRPSAARGVQMENRAAPDPAAIFSTGSAGSRRKAIFLVVGLIGIIAFLIGFFAKPIYNQWREIFATEPAPSPNATVPAASPSPKPAEPYRSQPPANSAPQSAPMVGPSAHPPSGSSDEPLPSLPTRPPVTTQPLPHDPVNAAGKVKSRAGQEVDGAKRKLEEKKKMEGKKKDE